MPVGKGLPSGTSVSSDAIGTILWESVWKALIRAFLIQILGGIALNLLGNLFSKMTPSLPPLGLKPEAHARTWPWSHEIGTFLTHNHFWIIFGALFLVITATRLAPFLTTPEHRQRAALFLLIHRRICSQWFRLFVGNAFAAWVSTIVIMALQQFSWTHLLWQWMSAAAQPLLQALGSLIPGAGSFSPWYSWYGQNQAKFLFWLLYSAAICDDLGLPNYKTLLRFAGERLKRYFRVRWGANTAA